MEWILGKESTGEQSRDRFTYIIASDLGEKTIKDQMTNAKTYRLVNPAHEEEKSPDDRSHSRFTDVDQKEKEIFLIEFTDTVIDP